MIINNHYPPYNDFWLRIIQKGIRFLKRKISEIISEIKKNQSCSQISAEDDQKFDKAVTSMIKLYKQGVISQEILKGNIEKLFNDFYGVKVDFNDLDLNDE